MHIVPINENFKARYSNVDPLVLVLGTFDGVHKGHQHLINEARNRAKKDGCKLGALVFFPHPGQILFPERRVNLLSNRNERINLLQKNHIDYLFAVNFTLNFAKIKAEAFVRYLCCLNVEHIFVGFDYKYGQGGMGDVDTLREQGKGYFQVSVVPPVEIEGSKVSSTRIRSLIASGDCLKASELLGSNYSICGKVIRGDGRGRTIGFPTANLSVSENKILPAEGVYAVTIKYVSSTYLGMCNIGHNPTFRNWGDSPLTIEVNLFDFDNDLYDEGICILFHRRIRAEKKFSSVEQLVDRLHKDKEESLAYFSLNAARDFIHYGNVQY